MHREGLRRSVRTVRKVIGREWNEGDRRNQRKEVSRVLYDDPEFRVSSWIARGGASAAVDWRNAFSLCQGSQIGVMPVICVRHFAAPLSRTGRSLQNPSRQQRPDPDAPPEPEKPERRINRAIVSRTIRLITNEGHKIFSRMEALRHAENMDLDLVEVDGKQDPPVCKLMDFNKERFKDKQREKQMKNKQSERRRLDDLKEVRFSTRTEQNDLELKAQMALRLLTRGHRVKLAIIPHGNDPLEPKGRELLDRMVALLKESSKVETGPRIERQRAWVLIRPTTVGPRAIAAKNKERAAAVGSTEDVSESDSEDNDDTR